MSMTRLTLYGMVKYEPNLLNFTGLLPSGMNAEAVEDAIISRCGELYPYYQVPKVLKERIQLWGGRRYLQWSRMWKALTEEYDPLHNYDRHEIHEESGKSSGTDSDIASGESSGTTEGSGTVEDKTSAFDSSTYEPESQSTNTTSGTDAAKTSTTRKGTKSDEFENDLNIHAYGNIGVTTSAQMLEGELNIRANDIYIIIAKEFEREFCSQCYS